MKNLMYPSVITILLALLVGDATGDDRLEQCRQKMAAENTEAEGRNSRMAALIGRLEAGQISWESADTQVCTFAREDLARLTNWPDRVGRDCWQMQSILAPDLDRQRIDAIVAISSVIGSVCQ